MATDLGGKRLELLKEILPRLARVAVLWNVANQYAGLVFKETQAAGQSLGIEVQSLKARGPDDIPSAFQAARQERTDGLIVVEDPLTFSHRKLISDLSAEGRLPAVHGFKEFVIVGGLSYGANLEDLFRRAAGYVDKILRGRKASRPSSSAADEIRFSNQSPGRQGARSDHPADATRYRRRGDGLTREGSFAASVHSPLLAEVLWCVMSGAGESGPSHPGPSTRS